MNSPAISCAHDALVATADLKPCPDNPNRHSKDQLALYAKILLHQGWRKAVLVSNQSGFIVTGHGAWLTAKAQGWEQVPVDYQDFACKADEVAHMIADNKLAQMAELDDVELARVIKADLAGTELDLTGFDLDGLREIGAVEPEPLVDAPPEIDRAEELRKKFGVERGQLWALGDHKLLCGDSTNAEDVARLLDLADAILTDPPYGQSQDGVPGDSPDEMARTIPAALALLPAKNAVAVLFQSPRTFPTALDAMRANGWTFERMLWLDKVAQCSYPWPGWILKSEAIIVFSRGEPNWNEVHPFVHDSYRVPEVSGELPESLGWHGSIKPLSVVADICQRISKPGQIVFDPFSGSGTTLMACEQLGRRCRAIELDPGYVGVTLQRFQDSFPGAKIERLA